MAWVPAAAVIAVLVIILIAMSLRIAKEYERGVVFRLGRLAGKRGPGLYLLFPFIERQILIDQRIVTAAVEKQEAITRDNVPVKVDAVVWYWIVDPAKSVVRVMNVYTAVTQISLTTLRNIIGRHTPDDVLKEKDKLAEEMRKTIDNVTEPWGVQVQMVEMKDVVIPESMQRAMAQEAEALREKRARIIKAEAGRPRRTKSWAFSGAGVGIRLLGRMPPKQRCMLKTLPAGPMSYFKKLLSDPDFNILAQKRALSISHEFR
jgi:regulator of protease activity HflC (stomatin/prohibitin superfamily)